jgi:cellulose synthase (UDP-forming)
MAHASITNSRIQGAYRHSFWAEVYETVLAWYILRPTMVALIDPHRGKFNVTAKGGLVDEQYHDWTISVPYLILIGLNVVGFGFGLARIQWGPSDEISTNVLNLVWTCYNLLILGAAVSVASESKQIRRSHRVRLDLPALLHLQNGKVIRCRTEDFSEGGIALLMPDQACTMELECGAPVSITLWRGDEEYAFPARLGAKTNTLLRLRWELTSQDQEIALVQSTFGRADAWVTWAAGRRRDQPLKGLRKVLRVGLQGYLRLAKQIMPYGNAPYGNVPRGMAPDRKVALKWAALAGLPRWIGSLLPRHAPDTLEPAP